MNRSVPVGEVRSIGDRAFLVGAADPDAGRTLAAQLAAHGEWSPASVDVVPAFETVLVALRDPELDADATEASLRALVVSGSGAAAPRRPAREVVVACTFDGPDLEEVATHVGCARDDVVAQLCAATLTVSVMGFSPGFAYLDGLPGPLRDIPRRARPRPSVPAGSVALANGHAAVYPTASPGGWQLIGRTAFRFFDPAAPPYAALVPGDVVRFRVAPPGGPADPSPMASPSDPATAGMRLVLEVVAPGLRAVLQDGGRHDVALLGVPAAGPADADSALLANRLVGNADTAGVVEITAGGTRVRCLSPCFVALVGGAPEVRLDGVPVPPGQVVPLAAEQLLEVGRLHGGLRTYLAVAGGFGGPELFASVASDELSGMGPGPLAPGQRLAAGAWSPPLGDHLLPDLPRPVTAGEPVVVRVVAGPHGERFVPDVLGRLAGRRFRVGQTSNRVGVRLEALDGDGVLDDLVLPRRGELDSQGVVTGAVQMPPGGELVVLGPDHATLGGYPVVAVVPAVDLALVGQCAPGSEVRLVPVGLDEARRAWRSWRHALAGAVRGHYPVATG